MATFADLFSLAFTLTHAGKSYELRKPNQLEQGKYQRWLEDRAAAGVERRNYPNDAAREMAERVLQRDIAAGVYEWGGEVAAAAVLSPDGAAKLVEIVCDVRPHIAREIIDTHIKQVLAVLAAASTDDPKALALALKTLGLSSDNLSSGSAIPPSTKRKRKSRR